MEKAKYIIDKEKTLFNDLDKSHKKMKEIANWHKLSMSGEELSFEEIKNAKIYIQLINNIYSELGNLLLNSKQFNLYGELKDLVTTTKLNTLEELEGFRMKLGK